MTGAGKNYKIESKMHQIAKNQRAPQRRCGAWVVSWCPRCASIRGSNGARDEGASFKQHSISFAAGYVHVRERRQQRDGGPAYKAASTTRHQPRPRFLSLPVRSHRDHGIMFGASKITGVCPLHFAGHCVDFVVDFAHKAH